MVSLSTADARNRILYMRPISSMPDIMMIDVPLDRRGPHLLSQRYHPILIETVAEQGELEAMFAEGGDVPRSLDLLDDRPSALQSDHISVAQYGSPGGDWPYVLLCRWPPELTVTAPTALRLFTRSAYTIEVFNDREQLEQASERVLALLKRRPGTKVEIIPPDWSAAPGTASH